MAIAVSHYSLIRKLREQNILPYFNTILELGEQNWYGDVSPKVLFDDIKLFAKESQKDVLTFQLKSILKKRTREIKRNSSSRNDVEKSYLAFLKLSARPWLASFRV